MVYNYQAWIQLKIWLLLNADLIWSDVIWHDVIDIRLELSTNDKILLF